MSDYVPRKDGDFDDWQATLREKVEEKRVAWEIPEVKVTELNTQGLNWEAKYVKTINRQNRTIADVRAKEDVRVVYEELLCKFVAQYLTSIDKVDDSDRELMGLTIRTGKHTPVPVPTTSPLLTIDFSVRLQHILNIVDDSMPHRKSKPKGVLGCEVWVKIGGEPPKNVSELMYVSMASKSSHLVVFDGSKTGQMVYYWLRWVNRRQQTGPWSAMYSAIVG